LAHCELSARRQPGPRKFDGRVAWLGFCLAALLGCTAETPATAPIAALAPNTARVWFLRAWDSPSGQGYVYGAEPVIFANGAPVGGIRTGTAFFRDFPPGTYRFTVQPIGLPTPQETTLQLAAGTETYLQVQWVASWQFGYPEVDFSFAPNTFTIFPMSQHVAQAYLPTLTNIGQR
jgi:hypothetical protein